LMVLRIISRMGRVPAVIPQVLDLEAMRSIGELEIKSRKKAGDKILQG